MTDRICPACGEPQGDDHECLDDRNLRDASSNRVWAVIDRRSNNVLDEFSTKDEAQAFFDGMLEADHRVGLRCEIVEAQLHAIPTSEAIPDRLKIGVLPKDCRSRGMGSPHLCGWPACDCKRAFPADPIPNRVIDWKTCSCGDTHLHPSDADATRNREAKTWFAVQATFHVAADSLEEAQNVVSEFYDHDQVMGGSFTTTEIGKEEPPGSSHEG